MEVKVFTKEGKEINDLSKLEMPIEIQNYIFRVLAAVSSL